ncbi:MAG: hypothetical protein Ct9H300mP1_38960 [Planctomycetaceae bacterium]|nr:MAG: hypothetical protein Ct9H300mP1_38960 [Planctomycetaceae bacterium]
MSSTANVDQRNRVPPRRNSISGRPGDHFSVYVLLLIGLLVGDVAYIATGNLADTVGLPGWLEWSRPALRPLLSMVATLGLPRFAIRSS